MVHAWADDAQRNTVYLASFRPRLFGIAVELLHPYAWLRCIQAIRAAKGSKLRLIALAFFGAKLAHIGQAQGWRHLHVHSCADSAYIAMFASLFSGISYSLTLHGPLTDYGPDQNLKWSHALFALVITEELREQVTRSLEGFLPPLVGVAPMGVDTSKFTRTTTYRPWKAGESCHIFSCGRLNPVKGHADLVEAVRLLRSKGINANLEIAGEDERGGDGYRRELMTVIVQAGMTNDVHLLGAVSEERVRDALEKAHVFSLASLREPLGVAIMEAMAFEVPVVVAISPGVRELVDPDINGLLVTPRSPLQLAEAIERILSDSGLAVKLGKAGREKVEKYFRSTRSAQALLDALTKCTPKASSGQL
jgi:colanic acid/amylovoran biosynthesis glycosyltransferase